MRLQCECLVTALSYNACHYLNVSLIMVISVVLIHWRLGCISGFTHSFLRDLIFRSQVFMCLTSFKNINSYRAILNNLNPGSIMFDPVMDSWRWIHWIIKMPYRAAPLNYNPPHYFISCRPTLWLTLSLTPITSCPKAHQCLCHPDHRRGHSCYTSISKRSRELAVDYVDGALRMKMKKMSSLEQL